MDEPSAPLGTKSRIISVDLVRGLIMVVMTLDHTRDFFHADAFLFSPTDLTKTTPAIFFTRFITHFCAPGFMLLAGISVCLQKEKMTKKDLAFFLLTRGLWLVVVEIVVIRFGFFFNFYYDLTFLTVFWVIGMGMIVLTGIIYLSDNAALIIGIFLVTTHSMFANLYLPENFMLTPWTLLMRVAPLPITPENLLIVAYPILPWTGIIILGYSLGRLYRPTVFRDKRTRTLRMVGLISISLFIVLRLINLYDDPWTAQKEPVFSLLSFLNISKSPPSLQFTLLTGGVIAMLLALAENVVTPIANFFLAFGRVPFFYFIVHFYLIHASALILYLTMSHKSFSGIDLHFAKSFGGVGAGSGVTLPWIYIIWLAVVLVLYPVCRAYANYKKSHKYWWLSYL